MEDTHLATGMPVAETGATMQERIDFLKQVIAFTEGNIRAYDVKAEICLAAFVLSGNPLIAMINSACGQPASRNVLVIMIVVYLATILFYLWVIWPVPAAKRRLTDGLDAKGLFYLHDPFAWVGTKYSEQLKRLVVEPELTAEALNLAYIRKVKARRLKNALITTLCTYCIIAAGFFGVGRCGL